MVGIEMQPTNDALRASAHLRALRHSRISSHAGHRASDEVYRFRVELEFVGNHINGHV